MYSAEPKEISLNVLFCFISRTKPKIYSINIDVKNVCSIRILVVDFLLTYHGMLSLIIYL